MGNLEKNLQTADQTGDKLNLNMMPVQEWNSSHKGVGWGCSYNYFIFAWGKELKEILNVA